MPFDLSDAQMVARGPAFKRYAKDTSKQWGPSSQRLLMAQRTENSYEEIDDGVEFAHALVREDPRLSGLRKWLDE